MRSRYVLIVPGDTHLDALVRLVAVFTDRIVAREDLSAVGQWRADGWVEVGAEGEAGQAEARMELLRAKLDRWQLRIPLTVLEQPDQAAVGVLVRYHPRVGTHTLLWSPEYGAMVSARSLTSTVESTLPLQLPDAVRDSLLGEPWDRYCATPVLDF